MSAATESAIWHDLECGAYTADLGLWLKLADTYGDPVLDIGAGTGRVAVALARAGHRVQAVELDPVLAAELTRRAAPLPVSVQRADACALQTAERFPLGIVPMQTIHLLADRRGFLRSMHRALVPGGVLAVALLGEGVEEFEAELEPDELLRDGVHYISRPTALRSTPNGITLERRRERVTAASSIVELDHKHLAVLDAQRLYAEADGFDALAPLAIAPTSEYAGSEVALLKRRPC
jgi:SAM-dependent methyltransferase